MARPSCQTCGGLGYIDPAPYTLLYACPDCDRADPVLPYWPAAKWDAYRALVYDPI